MRRNERGRARRAWTAEQQKAQKERHDKELAGLKLRQDFQLQGKLLAQRQRDGEAAIRRGFAELRRAETKLFSGKQSFFLQALARRTLVPP